ncbi:MAG TPA: CAP domain-containing protein [Candidatus Paceibacterota bacterium]
MYLIRPILILLAFFGGLYYFREPLRSAPEKFDALHSDYADSFKAKFKEIMSASSTSVLGGFTNFIPSAGGADATSTVQVPGPVTQTNSSTVSTAGNVPKQHSYGSDGDGTPLLPVTSNQSEQQLSVKGIISATNAERTKAKLGFLALDSGLTKSAELKLQDMFKNQYFQHVSPSGESVSDLAKKAGYEFIVVGENLALGIFAGDQQVVAAWMASPGHKKNILDVRYRDIGVAVGQGVYQGRKQWLVVQQFGKPLDACSSPNQTTKSHIENMRADIVVLESSINAKKAETEKLSGDAYTKSATEYNALVTQYNAKLDTLKESIAGYNASVRAFNLCAGLEESPL